jgi:hypothetical protein
MRTTAAKRAGGFDPRRDRGDAVRAALDARAEGATLRAAAKAAGVHVATLCRWQARSAVLKQCFAVAESIAFRRKWDGRPHGRPSVPWRRDCPRCGAAVEVCTAGGSAGFRFWRCSLWPACGFASWRPRAPGDCPGCGGPWYWSHSRESIGCPGFGCRVRIPGHQQRRTTPQNRTAPAADGVGWMGRGWSGRLPQVAASCRGQRWAAGTARSRGR